MVETDWARSERDISLVKGLLKKVDLSFDEGVADTLMVFDDENLVGTGSLDENVLKCIGIEPKYQGEGLLGTICTALVTKAHDNGNEHLFIYTKTKNEMLFKPFGFSRVTATEHVVLMENRKDGLKNYLKGLAGRRSGKVGAIVMKADPFTLGHRYLVEEAAKECNEVQVFVLSSKKSMFPPEKRLRLVKEGCKDLKNVIVNGTSDYLVSSATFPTYFLGDTASVFNAQLDIRIFLEAFVPELKITTRYVGTEPFSKVTDEYNQILIAALPKSGVSLRLIERKTVGGAIVSATRVREAIKAGRITQIKDLVSESTYKYLISKEVLKLFQTEKV